MKVNLDVDTLTLREVEDFETASGVPIGEIGGGKALSARVLRAIVWIMKRREDPAFTYEQAGDVRVTELELGETADPT